MIMRKIAFNFLDSDAEEWITAQLWIDITNELMIQTLVLSLVDKLSEGFSFRNLEISRQWSNLPP